MQTVNLCEDREPGHREEVVVALSKHMQFHISKPNGDSPTSTIMTRQGCQWVATVKIVGKTKTEAYGYAVALVFDAKRTATARREAKQAILDRQVEVRRANKAKRNAVYTPRSA